MVKFLAAIVDPLLTQTTETVEAYGSSGSSVAVTTASGNIWTITLSSATVTITLAGSGNPVAEALTLYLTQDGTGGRTVTWPGSVTWLPGSTPALANAPGALTVIVLESLDGGSTWYGSASDLALPLAVGNGGTGQVSNGTAGQLLASNGTASAWQGLLTQVTTVTGNTSAVQGQIVPVDATSGNVTITLPQEPFEGALAGVKMMATASGHTTSVATTAPDVMNRITGWTSGTAATSATLSVPGQGTLLSYNAPGISYAVTANGSSSATLTLTGSFGSSPFAAGQIVYLAGAATSPDALNTSYYCVFANLSGSVFTMKIDTTSAGTGQAAVVPAGMFVQASGSWTIISDDLPLSQLDARYGLPTTSGDMIYENSTPAPTRLPGNTSGTKNYLSMTSAVPSWGTIASGDVPTLNQSTTGNAATASAASGLTSATTTVNVASATAPSAAQVLTATDGTHATWQAAAGGTAIAVTPQGVGLGLMTVPFWAGTTSISLNQNQLYLYLVTAGKTQAITTFGCWAVTAAAGTVTNANLMGLYSDPGAGGTASLLATTSSMTTAFQTAVPNFDEGAITGPSSITSYTVTAGVNYYLGIIQNNGSTALHVAGPTGSQTWPATPVNNAVLGHYPAIFVASLTGSTLPGTVSLSAPSQSTATLFLYAR